MITLTRHLALPFDSLLESPLTILQPAFFGTPCAGQPLPDYTLRPFQGRATRLHACSGSVWASQLNAPPVTLAWRIYRVPCLIPFSSFGLLLHALFLSLPTDEWTANSFPCWWDLELSSLEHILLATASLIREVPFAQMPFKELRISSTLR